MSKASMTHRHILAALPGVIEKKRIGCLVCAKTFTRRQAYSICQFWKELEKYYEILAEIEKLRMG